MSEAAPLVREGASQPKRDGPSPEALKKTLLVISLTLVSSFCYLFYQTVFYGAGELVTPWPPPKGQVKVDTPASLGKAAPAQHDDGGAIIASPGHHRLRNPPCGCRSAYVQACVQVCVWLRYILVSVCLCVYLSVLVVNVYCLLCLSSLCGSVY